MAKQVLIQLHTRLSRAYLALARLFAYTCKEACSRHKEATAISGASKCQQQMYVVSYIHWSTVPQFKGFLSGAVLEREFS